MKKIAFHNRYTELNPLLFTEWNAPIGDDLLLPFLRLRQDAARRGIECVTLDKIEAADDLLGIVFIDRPVGGGPLGPYPIASRRIPYHLIAFENETICPENWENLGGFAKVFSFARAPSVLPERFVRLFPATQFAYDAPHQPAQGRRLAVMVSSNKQSAHPRSIYGLRGQVVNTFSAVGDFDLFGHGWNGAHSWRGELPPGTKRSVMSGYRFALVMENARIPDYITEKLFDAFLAGAVPVYWGAPNIAEWVDSAALIDASEFPSPAAILAHLLDMSEDEWINHRVAAARWMLSPGARPFSIDTFTKTILDAVLE